MTPRPQQAEPVDHEARISVLENNHDHLANTLEKVCAGLDDLRACVSEKANMLLRWAVGVLIGVVVTTGGAMVSLCIYIWHLRETL